jgi:hypothetical protein
LHRSPYPGAHQPPEDTTHAYFQKSLFSFVPSRHWISTLLYTFHYCSSSQFSFFSPSSWIFDTVVFTFFRSSLFNRPSAIQLPPSNSLVSNHYMRCFILSSPPQSNPSSCLDRFIPPCFLCCTHTPQPHTLPSPSPSPPPPPPPPLYAPALIFTRATTDPVTAQPRSRRTIRFHSAPPGRGACDEDYSWRP